MKDALEQTRYVRVSLAKGEHHIVERRDANDYRTLCGLSVSPDEHAIVARKFGADCLECGRERYRRTQQ